MSKKIYISTKPLSKKESALQVIDNWVRSDLKQGDKINTEDKKSDTIISGYKKRITIEVDSELHKKIKIYCVQNNKNLKEVLVEIISKEFGN